MIRYLQNYFNNHKIKKHLLSILAICAGISTIATYGYITSTTRNFEANHRFMMVLIIIDLILFLALIIAISRKLITIYGSKTGGVLQKRIVMMFSLGTAIPVIIVAVFSFILFNYGIQSWFNQKVSIAIEESVVVAEAYLKEHKENIKADALSMANDLNNEAYGLVNDPIYFSQFIEAQVNARSLSEAIIFRSDDRKILAKSRLSFSLLFSLDKITDADFENVNKNQAVILADDKNDRVRALVKLKSLSGIFSSDMYLLVGRLIDSNVLAHTEASQGAANEYNRLKSEIAQLQIQFSFIFLIAAMLLLVASIARGIVFATEITDPIRALLKATDRIRSGDFDFRVQERSKKDEVSVLGRAFNLMTEQIAKQRNELIEAANEIDVKRHFNEMVIAGVSAGIIAVDTDKKISVINKSACNMLVVQAFEVVETDIESVIPEFESLFDLSELTPDVPVQSEINIMRQGRKIALLVRIVAEKFNNHLQGYIITFDDITELLVAQRTAAWSDVARRIAHEVRNPLTPIRLASERLIKKYSHEVSDQETFTRYIDTIIRHVSNIGSIIDEFVNFARIPSPVFARCDLVNLVSNAVFARQITGNVIKYKLDTPDDEILVTIDEGQIDRILINLLKNAEESIEQNSNSKDGLIKVDVVIEGKFVNIIIEDNGAGFDSQIINRLTEPYITTKPKGSGLGLAIVKKIMDDHGGLISFTNNEGIGATVKLSLPI
ncbi:Alginate biosynthesis sensor protein KinB [Candidatus Arcanobacter lacustris]|jgi:two-component system nitrogen regulation sensor histidine kinase NtrY|uniref:Putative sensor histidine kinase NtrY-like n=1 Tax=Candidatus Arcanibacter lacustris TaxID=1607817 RepID=A0A0F5MRL4_9RICK|nr:Alginate biosynthesis sensor protein KinB [Candidatus Arcanobacter lacustris]